MTISAYPASPNATNPTNVHALKEFLKSADAIETLDKVGIKTIPVPMKKSETVSLTRWVTPDPTGFAEVAEGVNPTSRSVTAEQVTKTFEEFAEVFAVTSRQAELGEYDILMASKDRMLDLMLRIREQNAWNEYIGGTNVYYNSSSITQRTDVNGSPTFGRFQKAVREIQNNRGHVVRQMSKGSVNQDTTPVEPAYISLSHTDTQTTIRNFPGFVPAPKVGGLKEYIPQLFGYVDNICFITSQEFVPSLAGGAVIGSTGMKSVAGVNVDVYHWVIFAADALGKCSLRGMESKAGKGAVELNVLDKADKSDPTNQRRLVSCRWWDAPLILNDNWVYRVEGGVTDNP